MSNVIIKQRPQRPAANGTVNHFDAAQEDEPQPRGTAAPGAAGTYSHPRDRSPARESTGAGGRSGYAADEGGEAAAPPPAAAKTARPAMKESKGKKEKAAKVEAAAPAKKKSKKAKAGKEAAAPEAAARTTPPLKKNVRRVNILTVQEDAPIADGVNTPRSVALCEKHGIKPMELRPRTLRDFQNHAVKTELAELRFNSYEKRRKAHMALLLPKRKRIQRRLEEEKAAAEVASKEQSRARERSARRARTPLPRSYIGNARPEGESAQPGDNGSDVDDETRAMQRQFEEQHNRILEQERRQASANRGSTPRAARRSPSHSGTSPRNYHASVSRSSGIGLPASAAKIQSRSKTENRELYEGERIAIEEIIERDLYVQEIRERQAMLEENRQLLLVEERLEKEKAAAERLQRINDERDLEKQRKYFERKNRDEIAQERRMQAEEERQRKIADEMAEKEARIHATDPYASALSRRRYSTARSDRRRSSARGLSAPNAAYEEYEQHHDE